MSIREHFKKKIIKKFFLTVGMTEHWERLPRGLVVFLSLKVFKSHMSVVLVNLL